MTIDGLYEDYYLTGNDIWLPVIEFDEGGEVKELELTVTNLTTGATLPMFKFHPNPFGEFLFNISQIVRALMPLPNHIYPNSVQQFQFHFLGRYVDPAIPVQQQTIQKYFVRGGRNKDGDAKWNLETNQNLIVGKWIEWDGVTLPGTAYQKTGPNIIPLTPIPEVFIRTGCDVKILKFSNSIGGYQYFVFDKWEIKEKNKESKIQRVPTDYLGWDNFRNLEIESERSIIFHARTPFEAQLVFKELAKSLEVYLWNPGPANPSPTRPQNWERLKLEGSESYENNWDRMYENKIEFGFSKYVTNKI